MSAIPPIAQIDQASISSQIDAFRSALSEGGLRAGSDPNEIGRAMMAGLDNFRAQETDFKAATSQAISGDNTRIETLSGSGPANATSAPAEAIVPGTGTGSGTLATMQQSQHNAVGLMMQTYSFALEATLVSNAATTFTNSVNTLIKTQ